MITLFFFGSVIESFYRQYFFDLGFVLFYLGGLIVAIIPSYLKHKNDHRWASLGASGAELAAWYQKSGLPLKKFFNTSGLLYKSLDLKNKLSNMSEQEMLSLLATDGMLVKRPLLVGREFVLVGFKQAEWEEILK